MRTSDRHRRADDDGRGRLSVANSVPRSEPSGYVVLDQLRTVDRERLVKRLGVLTDRTLSEVLGGLVEMFAE